MKLFKIAPLVLAGILLPSVASAHCPLCTAGAGILVIIAASFGLSTVIIGTFIGAFALALALWLRQWPRKQYIKFQRPIVALVVFLSTVIPISSLAVEYVPLYVPFWGEYGRTFAINLYYLGVPLGMFAIWSSPYLSNLLAKMRGGMKYPYQGIVITFAQLFILSAIIQLLL
jgi:hypothetical protein